MIFEPKKLVAILLFWLAVWSPAVRAVEYSPNQLIVKYRSQSAAASGTPSAANFLDEFLRKLFGVTKTSTQFLDEKFQVYEKKPLFETVPTGQSLKFGQFDPRGLFGQAKSSALENVYLLKFQGKSVEEAVKEYQTDANVLYAEPNYEYRAFLESDDPFFKNGQMWGLEKIEAKSAWDQTTGSASVIAAVIDTGIDYNHEDFNKENIIKGPNYAYGGSDPRDDMGHGTHVSGTIGAATNNSKGVAGINWQVKILAIKVLASNGAGSLDAVARGVVYAADNGAKVINMSLGGYENSRTMAEAVSYALGKNVTVVAAAGNNGTSQIGYPAGYPGVISVAASDSQDKRASFSSYGSWVKIAAPGVGIYSTFPGSQYRSMSGTSMASPHVAGAAALLLARNPNLTPDQVLHALTDANCFSPIAETTISGKRLNLDKALRCVTGATPLPTKTPSPTVTPGGPTLTLAPTARAGDISIWNENESGGKLRDGQEVGLGGLIGVCYKVPVGYHLSVSVLGPERSQIPGSFYIEGYSSRGGGCYRGRLGSPLGKHYYILKGLDDGKKAETSLSVVGTGAPTSTPAAPTATLTLTRTPTPSPTSGAPTSTPIPSPTPPANPTATSTPRVTSTPTPTLPADYSLSLDKASPATYKIGEAIRVTYKIPSAGTIKINKIVYNEGQPNESTIYGPVYENQTTNTLSGVVGEPEGAHILKLYYNTREPVSVRFTAVKSTDYGR